MAKAISVKWLAATNTKGTRIKAYDCDGNNIVIPRDHSLDDRQQDAFAACLLSEKMNWAGIWVSGVGGNGETTFVNVAPNRLGNPYLFDYLASLPMGSWFETIKKGA